MPSAGFRAKSDSGKRANEEAMRAARLQRVHDKLARYQLLLEKKMIAQHEFDRVALKCAILEQEHKYRELVHNRLSSFKERRKQKTVLRTLKLEYKERYGAWRSKQEDSLLAAEQGVHDASQAAVLRAHAAASAQEETVDEYGRVRRAKTSDEAAGGASTPVTIEMYDEEPPLLLERIAVALVTFTKLLVQLRFDVIIDAIMHRKEKRLKKRRVKEASRSELAAAAISFVRQLALTVVLSTLVFYDTPGPAEFHMVERASAYFAGEYLSRPPHHGRLADVADIPSLWNWISTTLMTGAFGPVEIVPAQPGQAEQYVELLSDYRPLGVHTLLGGIRLRALRMSDVACPPFVPPLVVDETCRVHTAAPCSNASCAAELGAAFCAVGDGGGSSCTCAPGHCLRLVPATGIEACMVHAPSRHAGRRCTRAFSWASADREAYGPAGSPYTWSKDGSVGETWTNLGSVRRPHARTPARPPRLRDKAKRRGRQHARDSVCALAGATWPPTKRLGPVPCQLSLPSSPCRRCMATLARRR